MSGSYIFALDIGTRSVVGVVMQETAKGLEIVAAEHLEHQNRAMVDGQIHDVEQVARVIKVVKEKLEARIGQTLSQVAVAAAGRALKTVRLSVKSEIPDYREVHRDDILRLEMQAVQEAQNQLAQEEMSGVEEQHNYHCVGYSVVHYELDGFRIGNLYGQKGKVMGVEIIATFLPRLVVDSLLSALIRVDLEMRSLTLEPIAASAVVVPASMRQLNIALVDVGAGTSDIAITDDGAIVGYGMVPVAGDEITEKISQHYLVDFNQAEVIKRSLQGCDDISLIDVLGIEHTVSKKEVLDVILESVQMLAKQITERIMELNGKTPQAVICIGGGSLTPLLKDMLADNLGLSKQRVAVRGREAISEVFGAQELVGPEAVTPIGIAVTSYEHKGLGFARVTVNSEPVRLFEVNRGTVADALLAAGINIRKTQPRLGMALTVTVNGELKIIKGGRGKPAVIKLNNHDVTIDAPVKHNDALEFIEARNGENATGQIKDVVPEQTPLSVTINGVPYTIEPIITMNEEAVDRSCDLVDNARITYRLPRTAAEVLELSMGLDDGAEYKIYVNDRLVDLMTEIYDGDDLIVEKVGAEDQPMVAEAEPVCETEPDGEPKAGEAETGKAGEQIYIQSTLEAAASQDADNSGKGTLVYVNNDTIFIPRMNVILTDILTRVDFPLRPPEPGMKLEMKVNGVSAEFTTPLKNGDHIAMGWKA